MPPRTIAVLLLSLLLVLPAVTSAVDVQPGIDAVEHVVPTIWDFAPQPIAADFFGPGSDPFDGGIPGDQTSLDPTPDCPGASGPISMLIQRFDTAVLPTIGSSDVIDVEIIAMSLVSSTPITVTYNGGLNPEAWNVTITPSTLNISPGTMTVRFQVPNGGTFDSEILLRPHFTFERVSDGQIRELEGAGTYDDLISVSNVPWVYGDPGLTCPPCASNFIPGHDGINKVQYAYTGAMSQHTVRSACLAPIPTLSQWGQLAALTMLLIAGGYTIARRRRTRMA